MGFDLVHLIGILTRDQEAMNESVPREGIWKKKKGIFRIQEVQISGFFAYLSATLCSDLFPWVRTQVCNAG